MTTPNLTPQETALLESVAKYAERVTAQFGEQIVVIDLESSELDAPGHCTIRGDFGNEYTHGGWATKTRKTVEIAKLNNIVMQTPQGEMIQAKG